jgi:ribosomal protein L32
MKKKKKKKISLAQIKKLREKNPLLCKNCKLYDAAHRVCSVIVLDKGKKLELMAKPDDPCMWEKMGVPVHQIRAWSDGKNGYVEYTQDKERGEEEES